MTFASCTQETLIPIRRSTPASGTQALLEWLGSPIPWQARVEGEGVVMLRVDGARSPNNFALLEP